MTRDRIAWLFPGQGAQEPGMGRDVFEGSVSARRIYETADDTLGYSISKLCFDGPDERLQETRYAQPALFTTSIACLEAAREQGNLQPPAFVAGHSLGEYTALVAGGAIEFEHGLALVQERGRLMQSAAEAQPGAMAALIGIEEETAKQICSDTGVEVCNLNAPGQVVIGGRSDAVAQAMTLALERGAQRGVRLRVGGAFHTSMMQPAAEGMARAVANAPIRDATVPLVANTTAALIQREGDLRDELVQQLTRPVRWQQSMEELRSEGVHQVIEFGPGRVLTGLARRIDRSFAVHNVADMAGAVLEPSTPAPP